MSLPTFNTLYQMILFSCGIFTIAGVAEELTHAAAARPWAVRQDIGWEGVTTTVPNEMPRGVEVWISFAPFFVGLVVLALLYLNVGVPPLSHEAQLGIVAWGYYTVPSLSDVQQAAGADLPERKPLSKPARRGIQLYCLGGLLTIGGDELGVLLYGQPALTAVPAAFDPPITAFTISTACFWLGVVIASCATLILITEAKNQSQTPK
jgi:hypothetical protein